MQSIKFIVEARLWQDSNGNSYHSVQTTRLKDRKKLYSCNIYGYGTQYLKTAFEALRKNKWIKQKDYFLAIEQVQNSSEYVSRKRDMIAFGTE